MSEDERLSAAEIYDRLERAEAGARPYLLRILQHRPDADAFLARLVGHPDAEMRLATINLLAARVGQGVVGALISALEDDDARVSRAAARRLAIIGDPAAVEPLLARTRDARAAVRDESIRALGELGHPGATGRLIELLGSEEQAIRLSAAIALHKIGDPATAEALIAALADPSAQVRLWAVKGLAKIAAGRSTSTIEEALHGMAGDPDDYVRDVAQASLAVLGDSEKKTSIDAIPRSQWLFRTWLENPTMHAGSEMYTFQADGHGVVEDFYMGLTRDLARFEYLEEGETLAFRFENREQWVRTRFAIARDTFAHPHRGDVPCLKLVFETEPYFTEFRPRENSEYFYLP